jgi:hypothetical protein
VSLLLLLAAVKVQIEPWFIAALYVWGFPSLESFSAEPLDPQVTFHEFLSLSAEDSEEEKSPKIK